MKKMKKMKKIKVSQLENKNQFMIETPKATYFQSYNSIVAKYDHQKATLSVNKDWDYSNTTRKHLYIFVCEYCGVPYVANELEYSKNKRKTFLKLIKDKVIKINKKLD